MWQKLLVNIEKIFSILFETFFSTQKFIHGVGFAWVDHILWVINCDSSIVTNDLWVFPLMKALVSSSHHILWGMIGIGFWQSFSKAKSTLPLHCVKISMAFNVVASRVANKTILLITCSTRTFRLPVRTSKPEVDYFAMKPTIFRYRIMGK